MAIDPVPDAPHQITNGPGQIPDADEVMGNDESIREWLRTAVVPGLPVIGGVVESDQTDAHTSFQTLLTATPGVAGTYYTIGFFQIYDYSWASGEDTHGQLSVDSGAEVASGFQRERGAGGGDRIVPLMGIAVFQIDASATINLQGYKEGGSGQTIGDRGLFYLKVSD